MRNKLFLMASIAGIAVAFVSIIVPAGFGTTYQAVRADILLFGVLALLALPGKHVMKGVCLLFALLASWFFYAAVNGMVQLNPQTEAFSFADGAILAALMFALMANVARTPDSDYAHHPILMRVVSINFIAWAFVPFVMMQN